MGCLTQTRSAGQLKGSPGVVGTAVVVAAVAAAAAAAGGTTVVAVVGVTIPLAVEPVGAVSVVVPATLAVDASSQPVVGPIVPA